jgi:hypothetical protein
MPRYEQLITNLTGDKPRLIKTFTTTVTTGETLKAFDLFGVMDRKAICRQITFVNKTSVSATPYISAYDTTVLPNFKNKTSNAASTTSPAIVAETMTALSSGFSATFTSSLTGQTANTHGVSTKISSPFDSLYLEMVIASGAVIGETVEVWLTESF